jgi:four helix bundle protein
MFEWLWTLPASAAALFMVDTGRAERAAKQAAMKRRLVVFAKNVVLTCRRLPATPEARHLAHQLIRSSTSVAANYRASCRGRSKKEFIAKIGIVLEEADESLFWLEFGRELGLFNAESAEPLCDEANQLVAIFSRTRSTASRSIPQSLNP